MELSDNFDSAQWEKGDAAQQTGFVAYRVVKCTPGKAKGEFNYAICDQEGNLKKVTLNGGSGKRDPLHGISNAEFVLSEGGEIVSVNVEGDCVKRK